MTESQKDSLIKLVEALEAQIPYIYTTIGEQNVKLLAEAISEVKSVMREP